MYQSDIHSMTSKVEDDNAANTSNLKIKSQNINKLCGHFHAHLTSLSEVSDKMLRVLAFCIALTATVINLGRIVKQTSISSMREKSRKFVAGPAF